MSPEPEKSYRVWVEQWRCGWIVVDAPDEQTAKDRAQAHATTMGWSPDSEHASAFTVEEWTP